jgi:hypothetical protein
MGGRRFVHGRLPTTGIRRFQETKTAPEGAVFKLSNARSD